MAGAEKEDSRTGILPVRLGGGASRQAFPGRSLGTRKMRIFRQTVAVAVYQSRERWRNLVMDLRDYTRITLRGLSGVMVIVENVRDDAEEAGLNTLDLQKEIELQLGKADISVIPHEEWRETGGRPWLYVSINTIKYPTGYFFSLDLQLKQEVSLRRQPSIVTSSATWEIGSVGFVGTENLHAKVSESVSKFLEEFITDYAIANSDA
jgi:hypothetical protein